MSATEKRTRQLRLQLDRLRDNLSNKSRKYYKSDQMYMRQQMRAQELISEIESELSALSCPGEYEQLPLAIVADELSLSYEQVRNMVNLGEIVVNGRKAHQRVSRKELERISSLGSGELQCMFKQSSADIFEEAVSFFRDGKVELVERAYNRLDARESWQGVYAPACLIALELLKGELSSVLFSLKCLKEEIEPFQRIVIMAHLKKVLLVIKLKDDAARALCEKLLMTELEFKETWPSNSFSTVKKKE